MKYLFFIILLSLLPLSALLQPGMFWAHDSESHVVRVYEFYKSLAEGNLIPRWAGGLNAGYGHPVLMFLYPLANYLAALFHFLSFNFSDSVKLTLATGYIGSGIFMYLWLKRHFSIPAALIGAAVWQLAPYRFVNLYVRNAMGENTAFLFIPLTLLCFYALITKPSATKISLAAAAFAGFILSHNAVSLMFLPFLCVYIFILTWSSPRKLLTIHYSLLTFLLGLGASAFFWLPAMLEGKYTLRDIVMAGDTFAVHFPTLRQLIVPHWGYDNSYHGPDDDLSFQIGIIQWLAAIVGVRFVMKNKLSILALITFILGVFILLKISLPVWHLVPIIKKFQFPWRFLIIPVFSSSILAAGVIHHAKIKLLVPMIILVLFAQNFSYMKPRGDYLPPEEQIIKEYLGTTDTGESTPMWAVRSQDKHADNTLGVVWGAPITYDIIRRDAQIHEHTITASVKTQIAENTLYFPGWEAYVNGSKETIIFNDISWRGVITYPVPAGTSHVRVVFKETKTRKFSNILSLISLSFLILLIPLGRFRKIL